MSDHRATKPQSTCTRCGAPAVDRVSDVRVVRTYPPSVISTHRLCGCCADQLAAFLHPILSHRSGTR
jgi:hypothetical protein